MSMEWFRWYHGTINDPKLALIAKKSGQPRTAVLAVWIALLEHASQAERRGDIADLDVETLAVALDIEEDALSAIIAAMTTKGMIVDGGIAAWDKRQPQREDGAAERAKAWREKQKQQPANTPNASERNRTQPNAGERPDTDTDTDTEAETEVSQKRKEAPQAACASTPKAPSAPVSEAPTTEPTATPQKAPPRRATAKANKSPIPPDWTPAETTYALLEKHGIPRPFAEGCLDEFRLYWQERGESRAGWEATFVNNARRQWEHQPTARAPRRPPPPPPPPPSALTPEAARFESLLRNLNRPVIEGEIAHELH